MILILDFGSQYTQLIARKVRELNFYAEIHPFSISIKEIEKINPNGIILSGGPESIYTKKAPKPNSKIFNLNIPILGICYGLQYITDFFGGKVESVIKREYGPAQLQIKKSSLFLKDITEEKTVWMSHGDKVSILPKGFETLAITSNSNHAIIANKKKNIYGVQFHPEVQHTKEGKKFLKNFCLDICKAPKNWNMRNFAKKQIQALQEQVGNEKVLLGLSGGVDSLVTAKLLHLAIGDRLSCVYVDNGLMRLNETEAVQKNFEEYFDIPLHVVKAEKRFLSLLKNITSPEEKRKMSS